KECWPRDLPDISPSRSRWCSSAVRSTSFWGKIPFKLASQESVLLHFVAQGIAADAKLARGLGLVAAGLGQGLGEEIFFMLLKRQVRTAAVGEWLGLGTPQVRTCRRDGTLL